MKLRTNHSKIFDRNKTQNQYLSFHNLRQQYNANQEDIDRSLGRRDFDKMSKRRLITVLQKKKKILCQSTNTNISLNTKSTMLQNRLQRNLGSREPSREALSESLIRLYHEKKELEEVITNQCKNIQELKSILDYQSDRTIENTIRKLHINIKKHVKHASKSPTEKPRRPENTQDECIEQLPTELAYEEAASINESLKAAIGDQKDLSSELIRKIALQSQNLTKNLRQKCRLRSILK